MVFCVILSNDLYTKHDTQFIWRLNNTRVNQGTKDVGNVVKCSHVTSSTTPSNVIIGQEEKSLSLVSCEVFNSIFVLSSHVSDFQIHYHRV